MGGDIYPSALEKGLRSDQALTMTLAEMYIQRVSIRRIKMIIEHFYGTEISIVQVSRATAQLDVMLQ
jgi:putative transposase